MITYEELERMLDNPETPDSEIRKYLTPRPKVGRFRPEMMPDPAKVQFTADGDGQVENAIAWGNFFARKRRRRLFERRIEAGDKRPVLVSEGDSWFQFPLLIDDVIDHLGSDYLIWSLDAAGDTADNMVNKKMEYKTNLDLQKENNVRAFLFSGAGNDVIGEDENGDPVLGRLLNAHMQGKSAAWHINQPALKQVLGQLEANYSKVVTTIRADPDFKKLPIIFHGYDYAIPGGYEGDKRRPIYAAQDEWLGKPLRTKNIQDRKLQRDIIKILIDKLYDMLESIAGDPRKTNIHVVNVRGTLKVESDWNDEIHGTSAGFKKVAKNFRTVLKGIVPA